MKFQLNPKFLLLIYATGAALAIGAVLLLLQLDGVVNVSLYNYDLRFDPEWATPYWTFMRLALGLLACIAGLSLFSTLYIILCGRFAVPRVKSTAQPAKPEAKAPQREVEIEKKPPEGQNGVEVVAIPMVCSKCGKVFTQPLCMFDFKSGKPRLVNVCPYCNTILAVSGNSKMK